MGIFPTGGECLFICLFALIVTEMSWLFPVRIFLVNQVQLTFKSARRNFEINNEEMQSLLLIILTSIKMLCDREDI